MDSITLTGITAQGTHGVLDFEKQRPQTYVVDATLFLDLSAAGRTDDLAQTVDYGQIARRIVSVIHGPHCDLLEALADRIASAILQTSRVRSVIVTVHKPQAPLSVPFHDVTVRIERSQVAPGAAEGLATDSARAASAGGQPSRSREAREADNGAKKQVHRAILSLGGNLGDVASAMRQAIVSLDGIAGNQIMGISPLYRTTPWGMEADAPDFLNCVIELETLMEAHALLDTIHLIEAAHGRTRKVHWGSRPLDIDIIDFDGEVRADPTLTLPHPRAWQRAFVLAPLADLEPDFVLPGEHGGPVSKLLDACPDKDAVTCEGAEWILSPGTADPHDPSDDDSPDPSDRKDRH